MLERNKLDHRPAAVHLAPHSFHGMNGAANSLLLAEDVPEVLGHDLGGDALDDLAVGASPLAHWTAHDVGEVTQAAGRRPVAAYLLVEDARDLRQRPRSTTLSSSRTRRGSTVSARRALPRETRRTTARR